MAIASIANVPGDWPSLQHWSFAHLAHHRDCIAAVLRKYGVSLPLYPLDPIVEENMQNFLRQHQQMHGDLIQQLQLPAGQNLLQVDWMNQQQLQTWISQNFTEHLQFQNTLGVG
jgi:hypothetical protein